jgi:hypothetical protein
VLPVNSSGGELTGASGASNLQDPALCEGTEQQHQKQLIETSGEAFSFPTAASVVIIPDHEELVYHHAAASTALDATGHAGNVSFAPLCE